MATVSKVNVKLKLSDGKSGVINLPAPINMTLTDEDTGEPLWGVVFDALKATFATDDGASVVAADFNIIRTTTTEIANNYTGA